MACVQKRSCWVGIVDPEQDGDARHAVPALGDERHLVAVGIGQRLGRAESLACDLEADNARGRRRRQAGRANGSSSGSSRSCDGGAAACRRPACPCDRRQGQPSAARRRAARRAWSRTGRCRGAVWRNSWRKCTPKPGTGEKALRTDLSRHLEAVESRSRITFGCLDALETTHTNAATTPLRRDC